MNNDIKIILADDHPIFREGLIKIIQTEKTFKVVNIFGNGNEAFEFIRSKKPEIAILDISMPGRSGLEIAKLIHSENIKTHAIILTMYDDEEYLEEALANDVRGYLLKDSTVDEILICIKTILSGGFYISKELTEKLIKNKKEKSNKEQIKEKLSKLTATEIQILKLLSQNKTSHQIADEMCISFRTVQNHRTNITNKLGLTGYNSLLLFTIENKQLL